MTEDKKTMEELETLREEKAREAAALRERAKILIMKGKSSAKKMNEGLSLLKEAFGWGRPGGRIHSRKINAGWIFEAQKRKSSGNSHETAGICL